MGYSGAGLAVGVNNINTSRARPGVVWPALVRHLLSQPDLSSMRRTLRAAPITSGRSFLLASRDEAEFWEVMPDLSEQVSRLALPERGDLFHTNHCLGEQARLREIASALSSTTHVRYSLIQKKIGNVQSWEDVISLLNDHENYPQSICSNYQSGAQDPSVTCGGAAGDLATGKVVMWRGDALYDANFVQHAFEMGKDHGG
jgi:isopenicillin-N N-acyltransferase-like protein